ncbi:anticodon nuclease [Acinetobacter towneri]|uniref:anticodon nuclease n=1 Tax=Acinetobacter towneri TaxID=202956 RepID=UPI0020974C04|nr:anticodon nuclease [Acinetobacter towneri]MCO8058007.1 anticodon nuclease [Acinetobacter towneri]MCO8063653.1 anticodon nuclease [Acinetobacter towneri]
MSKTLTDIAKQLSTPITLKKMVREEKRSIPPKEVEEEKPVPKVQLIYAFNGTGKTRLSREFKKIIVDSEGEGTAPTREKILYYNAFTEDLFYWDNDLEGDSEPKLKIQPNTYTDWLLALLKDLGQDGNIVKYFQHYTNDKLTPSFNADLTEVTFTFERGDNENSETLKISKGEESNFIWSVFYTLLDQVITILNVADPTDRETNQFDQLEYVFIDDPVSSLDENHLIELAVNLANLIKSSQSNLKFVITTHSPLFYNVLYNELKNKSCYLLEKFEDGSYALAEKHGDSNKSFSYHLYLKETLEKAIAEEVVQKYHFTLLRNLYEKTASFLGYPKWSELLPDDKEAYFNRIIQFTSHSTLSDMAVSEPSDPEKKTVELLLNHLVSNYGYWQREQ